MIDLYSQNILEHSKNPHNYGEIKDADARHEEANYTCGDKLAVDLKIKGGKIEKIKFHGGGCAISQAAMSILTDYVQGKKIAEIIGMNFDDMQNILSVPISERRKNCAMLGLEVIQKALMKAKTKKL